MGAHLKGTVMSIAEIERFAADTKSNETLRGEAMKAHDDKSHATPVASVVAFAATKGYSFTVVELKEHAKATAKAAGREITDAELDGVAGGAKENPTQSPIGRPAWSEVITDPLIFIPTNRNP